MPDKPFRDATNFKSSTYSNFKMKVSDDGNKKYEIQYKLDPPEGGWGNVLVISMAVMFIVTVGPLASFGIVYGKYLATLSDEASATAILTCVFNTVLNFMGLVANHLLRNRSCRFVGVIGSISFFLGNFLSVFATSLMQLTITFGVLQGIGFGLMLSATFASFNEYFIRRKNFMMGISQTIVGAAVMVIPYISRKLMDEYGYRGTIAILSAMSLHAFAAMITLQPVEWHMIKVPVSAIEMSFLPAQNDKVREISSDTKNTQEKNEKFIEFPPKIEIKPSCMNKIWRSVSTFLELSLLKDPSYVNIAVGISLAFMSDIMFLSLLPMLIYHMGYNHDETAYLMTVYVAADLLGRMLLSVLSAALRIRNRTLFLFGCIATAVFRIAFAMNPASQWIVVLVFVIALGILRCLIQVTVPLVLAEYSQTRFSAAFGLYLAICGLVSLGSGQLSSLVAVNTTGDAWVQHLLTIQILLCVFPWLIEMIWNKLRK